MKCHFYVHRHLNLLGMFSIWCSCWKFCNNCWDLFLNLSECPTSWTLQQLPLLISLSHISGTSAKIAFVLSHCYLLLLILPLANHIKIVKVGFGNLIIIGSSSEFRTTTFWLAPFFVEFAAFLWEKRSKLEVSQEGKGARIEVRWRFGREWLRLVITSWKVRQIAIEKCATYRRDCKGSILNC